MASPNGTTAPTAEQPIDSRLMLAAISGVLDRAQYANRVRDSHDGRRDYYRVLGYPSRINFEHYWQRYCRQSLATRVIDLPVEATWGGRIGIAGFPEWEKFEGRLDVTARLTELDRLAGIGHYAVLLIGVAEDSDVTEERRLEQPVTSLGSLDDIVFLRQYPENRAGILELEQDPTNQDFGKPKFYHIDIDIDSSSQGKTANTAKRKVHASRVIHVTSKAILNDLYGIPRLENIYDHLIDLDKVVGGGAEMWWQGADRFLHFSAKDRVGPETKTAVETQMEEVIHGLRRYMLTSSAEVNTLASVQPDPRAFFDVLTHMIAAGSGIPLRILLGSERGELASTQDRDNFADSIDRRRQNYAEPRILNRLLRRLLEWGVGVPMESLDVLWPTIEHLGPMEQAKLADLRLGAVEKAERASATGNILGDNELRGMLGFQDRPEPAEVEPADELDPAVAAQFRRSKAA